MIETTKSTVMDNILKRNLDNLTGKAFESFGYSIDYKTFFDAVNQYAKAYTEMGVKSGDVVTLCLAGTLDTIINFYALNKIGAISNLINPNFIKFNPKKYIDETDSKLLVIMDRFYPALKEAIEQSNTKRIILSSLTEYSSLLYRLVIRRKTPKKDELIPGVEYMTLPEFNRLGEMSNIELEELPYEPDRIATISYTSGTTGNPKGVILTNDCLNNMISIYDIKNGFGSRRGDKNLVLIPPMYGTSLCHSINTPLAFGCTTQLQPIYNPKTFAKDLLKYRPKIVVGSKAHYISLLNEHLKAGSLDFLEMAFCGGEPITPELARDINEMLTYLGAQRMIIGYGMTEFGTMTMFNMDMPNRVNESGYLLPEVEARIIDPLTGEIITEPERQGQLQISSPCMMKGYFNDPERTSNFFVEEKDKKWGKTGDIASMNKDGSYNVTGRENDSLINSSGEIVYLFEIENAIEKIEYVRECEVVALTIDGEKKAVAHIILKKKYPENIKHKILDYINAYIKQNLPEKDIPFAYKIRDSFDTSPISGKRDSESLKYETDGYIIFIDGLQMEQNIDSEESKHTNDFIQEVKKLNLKIK